MQLWQDGLVAMLAAVGVISLLWAFAQAVFFMKLPAAKSALALLPARGDGSELQEQIYALMGFSRDQGIIGRILVVDCGLNEEGQKLCRILARENRWVILCGIEDVTNYLTDTT